MAVVAAIRPADNRAVNFMVAVVEERTVDWSPR
jgi:hypothetical protein